MKNNTPQLLAESEQQFIDSIKSQTRKKILKNSLPLSAQALSDSMRLEEPTHLGNLNKRRPDENEVDYLALSRLATEVLGPLASTACLPIELIKKYSDWYPQSLTVYAEQGKPRGFFVLVPLSDLDSSALDQGVYKSGFDLAKAHETLRPDWSSAREFYLMGIYAIPGHTQTIKNLLESNLKKTNAMKVYAKGTTKKGQRWMQKRGFAKISATSPISFLIL